MSSNERSHSEGFCLMKYRADQDLTQSEVVWNSRDGVSPFVITLRNGMTATHVNWHEDVYRPDHKPTVGDRIFVDLTPEAASRYAQQRARDWYHREDDFGQQARATYASEQEMAAALEFGYRDEALRGAPDLVEVTEEMARERGWLAQIPGQV